MEEKIITKKYLLTLKTRFTTCHCQILAPFTHANIRKLALKKIKIDGMQLHVNYQNFKNTKLKRKTDTIATCE